MLGSTIIDYIFLLFIDNFKVGFPGGSDAVQQTWVQSLGQEDPLKKGMRIPWSEQSGGLQSMELQRVRSD